MVIAVPIPFYLLTLFGAPDVGEPAAPQYVPGMAAVVQRLPIAAPLSLAGMATRWGEGVRRFHPKLEVVVEPAGAKATLAAMLAERRELALLSREPTGDELAEPRKRWGAAPVVAIAARDPVAVLVNAENPIAARGLSLAELRAVFGSGEGEAPALAWGGFLPDDARWRAIAVTPFASAQNHEQQVFFQAKVLEGRTFTPRVRMARFLHNALRAEPGGVCLDGRPSAGIAAVSISAMKGEPPTPFPTTAAEARNYPLTRSPTLLVTPGADGALSPGARELVKWIASAQGAEAVEVEGFFPMTDGEARDLRAKLAKALAE